jgi:hypothetical protein
LVSIIPSYLLYLILKYIAWPDIIACGVWFILQCLGKWLRIRRDIRIRQKICHSELIPSGNCFKLGEILGKHGTGTSIGNVFPHYPFYSIPFLVGQRLDHTF